MRHLLLLLVLACSLTSGYSPAKADAPTAPIKQQGEPAPDSSWEPKEYIAALALLVSAVSLLITSVKDLKTGQGVLTKAFQGDKDAVTQLAYKVANDRWNGRLYGHIMPWTRVWGRRSFQREVITALCLAWCSEAPPRAKALIFAALVRIKDRRQALAISQVIETLLTQYQGYAATFADTDCAPKDFASQVNELACLRQKLQLS